MKKIILPLLFLAGPAGAAPAMIPAQPVIAARDCILKIVAEKMGASVNPEFEKPTIRPQTNTALKDFQDSMEQWWHMRPDAFTNVYNPLRNEIFIMTERAYYKKHERSVYDSLAHELAHYVQKEYKGADISQPDDTLEMGAIEVQTWFRETYRSQFQKDQFICPEPST